MAVKNIPFPILLAVMLLLAACVVEEQPQLDIPQPPTPTTAVAEPVPTSEAARVLSICLGTEPRSLFLYDSNSFSAQVIRQALFDGPVDRVNYEPRPAILERIPSLANGDVRLEPAVIQAGERMVDASGNITFLTEGTVYRPAGCLAAECEEVYQGQDDVTLDQLVIRFHLLSGLRWSDGEPLQAEDSLYSFRVAQDLYGEFGPPGVQFAKSYRVIDEQVVEWVGVPGFLGVSSYADFFFTPLPRHRWQGIDPEQLMYMEGARKDPLGWGPYMIKEWLPGVRLTLVENPYYFLGDAGQPYYDHLVFRLVGNVSETLAAFRAGECELALGVPGLVGEISTLQDWEIEDQLNLVRLYGGAWDQVVFGIQSLDEGVPYFHDPRTRQAVAYCVDRQSLVSRLPEAPRVADSYYPAGHPGFNTDITRYRHDPAEGMDLLEEVGWVDEDGDPATPRRAKNIDGVSDGTALEVELLLSRSRKAELIGEAIKADLGGCGMDVRLKRMPAEELLAAGPDGPVFGRKFNLAQFAWTPGDYRLCSLFLSTEIPGPYPEFPKGWGGGNAPGYTDEVFDMACRESLHLLPDLEQTQDARAEAQEIFAEDLPVLPLYFRQDVLIAKSVFSGMEDGTYIPLWNIESLP